MRVQNYRTPIMGYGESDRAHNKKDKIMLKIIERFKKKKRKIITLNYRDKIFAVNQPKYSLAIIEYGDYFEIAIDGVKEISWTY